MSDFYSVLTQSIIDRGLRSARDREATYSQARTAMIRRLWSYDPPLAEDEIDARIGQFDLAVDRIENDVVEVFERTPEVDEVVEGAPEPAQSLPIIDGYDQDADYSPAFGGGGPLGGEEPRRPAAEAAVERSSLADLLSTLDIRSLAVEAALNSHPDALPTADGAEADLSPDDDDDSQAYGKEDDGPTYDDAGDDRAYDDPDEVQAYDEPEEERETTRTFLPVPLHQAREMTDYYQRAEEAVLVEPARRQAARAETRPASPAPRRRPPAPAMDQSRTRKPSRRPATARPATPQRPARRGLSGSQRLGLLIGAVGALAVALIALTAYVLMPATNAPTVEAQTPPAAPGAVQPKGLPPPVEASLRRFVIFDGSDPTVFETDPSNPVRFDGSTARIASSAASAGAKALIGPGLASRLGGHTVRVTIMARTARENGTANLRFAFQSGLAFSYWKTASLTEEFVPIDLTWRIPTLRTDPTGDAIIIEPGIPGDSTGAEIGAIVIDMLD